MVLWASGLLLASSSAGLVRLSSLRRTVSPWFGRVSLHCNLCGNQNNVPPLRESAPPTIAANVEPASANEPPGTDSSPLLSLTVTGCTGSIGLATAGRWAFCRGSLTCRVPHRQRPHHRTRAPTGAVQGSIAAAVAVAALVLARLPARSSACSYRNWLGTH
jgi:hypothetical protein